MALSLERPQATRVAPHFGAAAPAPEPPPQTGEPSRTERLGVRLKAGVRAMGDYFTPADWKKHHYVMPGSLTGDLLLGGLTGVVLSLPTFGAAAIFTAPTLIVSIITLNLIYRFLTACGGSDANVRPPAAA